MSGVTYLLDDGRRCLTCPGCGQACRVDLHGDRLALRCYGVCDEETVASLIDTEAVVSELRKLSNRENDGNESVERPAVDPPPGDELLEEIAAFVRRFVVLPSKEAGDLLALWVLHTHCIESAWATPYLRVVSAAPDSGKTLLMEVLAAISRRGWHAINPSVAVLYRKVDRQQPTLLLDEMDNYPMDERRDALSVLNAGYKRGATVPRCNDRGDLEEFRVYCPKAYAGLDQRALVATLLSRSITIRLEKKTATENVDMWIAPLVEPEAEALRERCEAWADHNAEALTSRKPDLVGMINRAAEVWWALLAIAEHAGGDWPQRARHAARSLTTGGDSTDDAPEQERLLLDIREAFGDERAIFTDVLLTKLNALEEIPPRLDTPLLFGAARGKVLNLDNWRRRVWAPAIEAAAIATPARIYDLRSTFASNALAAGISVFELARIMGTSVQMIERHYGTLLDGSGAGIASRLDAFEAGQESSEARRLS